LLLGVPNKKLLRKAIQPAEVEVNGMDNFGVKIEPIRKGARSSVSAFPGGKRDIAGLQEAYKELKRPKVGRMARLRGTVEPIADSPREPTPTTRSWPKGLQKCG
jgi:hypothetical protein